jgi:uncharacterized membrane protein
MVNKIKAIFAAIGSLGLLMLGVSLILWAFTQWPARVLEFIIILLFARLGYGAYKFFLKEFEKPKDNNQINNR